MSLFQTRSRNNSFATSPSHQQLQPMTFSQSNNNNSSNSPSGSSSHPSLLHDASSDQHHNQHDSHPPQQHLNTTSGTRPATVARPQLFSDFFRRYELMIEFTNLKNPHHCPSGLYVMPAADNMNQWFGTLFIHKGYYRNAVFKFQMVIPADYPNRRPVVQFLSDMWHPLVDQQGFLALQYQFPQWRPHRDYLFHVLHFVKAIFKKCFLDTIQEKQALNKEAFRIYRQENKIFGKLAQQRAQLSITDSSLYDNFPANNPIKFTSLSEEEFSDLKQKMMNSVSSIGIPSSSSLVAENHSMLLESLKTRVTD